MLAEKQNEGKEEEEAYEFVVVGAGPAGLTAVATLIDNGVTRIAWVDDSFVGGRLGEKYREIPSNTKIRLFLDYVAASSTLTKLVQEETTDIPINPYTTLKELDQDRGNRLSYAADLMVLLTRRITSTHCKIIDRFQGRVKSLELVNGVDWMVKMDEMDSNGLDQLKILKTKKAIFATGSEPIQPKEIIDIPSIIDLEIALSPSQLEVVLQDIDLNNQSIAVVGSSHSAFLVMRNLITLSTHLKVVHLFRNPELKFAQQKEGWILYDNTGLKGEIAGWAKNEYPILTVNNDQRRISRIQINNSLSHDHDHHLKDCCRVIYAIGYQSNPTPRVMIDGIEQKLNFDNSTGRFNGLPGLFGCGIAFPQRVVDPAGNVELAVGIFKFMKFLKLVIPSWIQP
ncbi:hypothetical protein MJO29_010604 [Puccinia striiformis f. sp. tritici]|uniref:FAD/NAD(P)-binding domain-containing protein n=1 Tax=Puccinia striiformis f. sp. tritici PST-78 TaxID=1165861 RepID=A0A0L0UXQ7_9BASI|nr:hypothetical protein Pst134EB_020592 [Puccinia striiformis f. sp. tritici]KAI7948939.1 hypothetical protein MJO29_010604 [Puccinia striiformis f. sp. tritici]KAI9618686.1 hypothetical protein KEM48_006571 [Puccinia striiformis f. sp. tritici PST-130]KNE91832.1 hypothetical protein PSTG_14738 [Puccinia striiformis f. sp. tritici PST-78]